MKRGLTVAVAGAAILVAGLSGCSSNKSTTGSGETTTAAGTTASPGAASGPKVVIDGKDQNVTGSVVCTTAAGNVNIAIGGAATGIAAVLTDGNPPEVKSVGLGNVNGVTLGYTSGAPDRVTPRQPRTAATTRSLGPLPGSTWPTRCHR